MNLGKLCLLSGVFFFFLIGSEIASAGGRNSKPQDKKPGQTHVVSEADSQRQLRREDSMPVSEFEMVYQDPSDKIVDALIENNTFKLKEIEVDGKILRPLYYYGEENLLSIYYLQKNSNLNNQFDFDFHRLDVNLQTKEKIYKGLISSQNSASIFYFIPVSYNQETQSELESLNRVFDDLKKEIIFLQEEIEAAENSVIEDEDYINLNKEVEWMQDSSNLESPSNTRNRLNLIYRVSCTQEALTKKRSPALSASQLKTTEENTSGNLNAEDARLTNEFEAENPEDYREYIKFIDNLGNVRNGIIERELKKEYDKYLSFLEDKKEQLIQKKKELLGQKTLRLKERLEQKIKRQNQIQTLLNYLPNPFDYFITYSKNGNNSSVTGFVVSDEKGFSFDLVGGLSGNDFEFTDCEKKESFFIFKNKRKNKITVINKLSFLGLQIESDGSSEEDDNQSEHSYSTASFHMKRGLNQRGSLRAGSELDYRRPSAQPSVASSSCRSDQTKDTSISIASKSKSRLK